MNFLVDDFPTCLNVDGNTIPIDTDFRTMIEFDTLINDPNKNKDQYLNELLTLLIDYESLDDSINFTEENIIELYYQIIAFYLMEDVEKVRETFKINQDEEEDEEYKDRPVKRPSFSLKHDGGYIYSSFFECYGIDLRELDYLHWWEFKALLEGLSEETIFKKIIGYRVMSLSGLNTDQKKHYLKLKRSYQLPDDRSDIEKMSDFAKGLGL